LVPCHGGRRRKERGRELARTGFLRFGGKGGKRGDPNLRPQNPSWRARRKGKRKQAPQVSSDYQGRRGRGVLESGQRRVNSARLPQKEEGEKEKKDSKRRKKKELVRYPSS